MTPQATPRSKVQCVFGDVAVDTCVLCAILFCRPSGLPRLPRSLDWLLFPGPAVCSGPGAGLFQQLFGWPKAEVFQEGLVLHDRT